MGDISGASGALNASTLKEDGHTNGVKAGDARHMIEVKQTAHEGLGVFAKGHIPAGTRILCEPLLLALDGGEDPREIFRAFNKLSKADQARFLELHAFAAPVRKEHVQKYMKKKWENLSEHERNVIGIYDANSFEVGVFFLPSRVNHSCIPNAHYEYNPVIQKGTYHAVRDIEKSEEVYISYIHGGTRVKSWRQPKLDVWGFVCSCPACENTEEGNKRERRRKEMFDLDQKLAIQGAYGTEMTPMQAVKTATKLASLMLAEGILNRELRLSYHDAARYCVAMKNFEMALLWVEKELAVERICLGEDHPIYQAASARVGLLKDVVNEKCTFEPTMAEYFE